MDIPKKFCHECGKQIVFGAKFCPECGTSQASIDEKRPNHQPIPAVPNRVAPRQPSTFTPMASGEDDEDDGVIRADRAHSLGELGISLAGLDVDLRIDSPQRETVGGLVAQGKQLPEGYKDPNARITLPVANTKAIAAQILAEGNNPAQRLSR